MKYPNTLVCDPISISLSPTLAHPYAHCTLFKFIVHPPSIITDLIFPPLTHLML